MPHAAILLSRQPRRPCARDLWVQKTTQAVDFLTSKNSTIVSSVGLQTWELITAVVSMRGAKLHLVVPGISIDEFNRKTARLREEFALTDRQTEFESVAIPKGTDKAGAQTLRDSAVISRADILVPLSIRPDGNMAQAIRNAEQAGREIIRDFQIPYARREEPIAYDIKPEQVSRQLHKIGRDYLIHWTRASNTSWPGERKIDFYRGVISAGRYPRTAFDTLLRILTTHRLIGSPRHMPGRTRAVSFTGLSPLDCLPLMRWRARFGEMSFEPYGIGLRRSWAEKIGIEPVIYYENAGRPPVGVEPWRTQSRGIKTDWRQEDEYRFRGDLDLSGIPPDQMIAFCVTRDEATRIEKENEVRVVSLY
ncbi:MAG: hypothetical protein HY851_11775 [candidate division Zixibacteria bacterium]|nr:hypothetical protein [candidate division Zixibacteria bacterium]